MNCTTSVKVFQDKCYEVAANIVTELDAASQAGTLRLHEDSYTFADLIANLSVTAPTLQHQGHYQRDHPD